MDKSLPRITTGNYSLVWLDIRSPTQHINQATRHRCGQQPSTLDPELIRERNDIGSRVAKVPQRNSDHGVPLALLVVEHAMSSPKSVGNFARIGEDYLKNAIVCM